MHFSYLWFHIQSISSFFISLLNNYFLYYKIHLKIFHLFYSKIDLYSMFLLYFLYFKHINQIKNIVFNINKIKLSNYVNVYLIIYIVCRIL